METLTTAVIDTDERGRMTTKTPCCHYATKFSPNVRFTFRSCAACGLIYNVTVDPIAGVIEWEERVTEDT